MHQLWMHNQYGRKFETRMSTSSKGLNERHRLHAYVSTTVYDRSWKGTTEQFVLHFHEQFRQLDELTPLNEQLLTGFYLKLNSFWSCSHMNELLSTLHVTHQSTYFIYLFHRVDFKFERISRIQQIHQKLSRKQDENNFG